MELRMLSELPSFRAGLWSNGPAHAAQITILVNQGALSACAIWRRLREGERHKVVIDFVGLRAGRKDQHRAPGDVVVNFMPRSRPHQAQQGGRSVVEFARAGNGVA